MVDYQLNWNDRFDSRRAGSLLPVRLSAIAGCSSGDGRRLSRTHGDAAVNDLVLSRLRGSLSWCARGQLSIAELAEAHIRQIERLDPLLNAFADFDGERVRVRARQLDASREPRGALYGLPVTVKSSIATAGYQV